MCCRFFPNKFAISGYIKVNYLNYTAAPKGGKNTKQKQKPVARISSGTTDFAYLTDITPAPF